MVNPILQARCATSVVGASWSPCSMTSESRRTALPLRTLGSGCHVSRVLPSARRHSCSALVAIVVLQTATRPSIYNNAMDDDLIVVDDLEPYSFSRPTPGLIASTSALPPNISINTSTTTSTRPQRAAAAAGVTARQRNTPSLGDLSLSTNERTTRSAHARARGGSSSGGAPKLKLKLSDKAAAQAPGMSFLGAYDRELDSDDEELSFEEQFILRLPPGEDCERLRKMVAAREVGQDVWFKFKGPFLLMGENFRSGGCWVLMF